MDSWIVGIALFIVAYFTYNASGQSMDPRVNITETDPASDGFRVRGFIATDVQLNCYVENLPDELQVRWQRTMYDKNGRETTQDISVDMSVEDNNKWSIEKPTSYSWRLRIKALTEHDEGNYTCFVRLTSNNDRAESNRTVFAYSIPLILEAESSSDVFAKEGDLLPLKCNATGRPNPTIIWRRQGNAILPGGGVRHIGGDLTIENVQYDARGLYICEAFNEVGYDRRDITVTVQHAPKLTSADETVGQALGYQRTLICYIAAYPAPSMDPDNNQLYWSKNSQRILPSTDRWETSAMEGAYGTITYELTIFEVQGDDYGMYKCHAATNLGSAFIEMELYETDTPQSDKQGPVDSASLNRFSIPTLFLCLFLLLITSHR